MQFSAAVDVGWDCAVDSSNLVTCVTVADVGAAPDLQLVAIPDAISGPVSVTGRVASAVHDPDPANNLTVEVTTLVASTRLFIPITIR